MNEAEFDVLDELYFVISFADLLNSVEMDSEELINVLRHLYEKEWIKILDSPEKPVFEGVNLNESAEHYYYLASKKGLLAHNSNEA